MIQQFSDFATTQAITEGGALPKDGYVVKLLKAEIKEGNNGKYVQIAYDIAEGEFKDYFMNGYKNRQDENKKWSAYFFLSIPKDDGSKKDAFIKRLFKTFTNALEDSNNGYHFDWDESKFKDKLIGGLFHIEEYQRNDGKIGRSTKMKEVCSVSNIRDGQFKLPEDKLLTTTSTPTDFTNIPANIDEELPF